MNITSLENTRVHNAKRYTKAERCSRAARGTSRAKQGKSWKEELQQSSSFCCTLTTTGGSATHYDQLQPSHHGPGESGYENSGLSDATLRVHIVKPSGVHNRYMCTGNVYREYKHI